MKPPNLPHSQKSRPSRLRKDPPKSNTQNTREFREFENLLRRAARFFENQKLKKSRVPPKK